MALEIQGRERRKLRIRKKIVGTPERLRLSVFRSAKHIYAQVIDDIKGVTVAAASTVAKSTKGTITGKKVDQAKLVGKALAEACKSKNIDSVVFDRGGFRYHGRVKAVAEGAREGGLKF
jgi:large subunit ribosomal protein L18